MKYLVLLSLLLSSVALAGNLDQYNIVWNSPSKDSMDSMPLSGRLGAGANVWVQDGSLWLYLAHNAAYDESGRLLKLGCVRITPTDKSLADAKDFRQELDLATGSIRIKAGNFAASLWFAGEMLMIETTSGKPQALEIAFGTWRDQKRDGIKLDVWGAETVQPDKVVADAAGIIWSHRNADYPFDVPGLAKRQGIPKEALVDPTKQMVFGGALAVEGGLTTAIESPDKWQFWEGKAWIASTTPRSRQVIAIVLRAQRDGNPSKWLNEAKAALVPSALKMAKVDEAKRWAEFWSRSFIVINSGAKPDDPGWQVGRNYQLFRYMLACNRGGALPLLFNGGIFTTDAFPGKITGNNNGSLPTSPGAPTTPDFRRWSGCHFMSQNQRWIGWPTLAAGDTDLFMPSEKYYLDRAAVAAARAHTIGAEGMVYPEPMDIWGLCCVNPLGNGLCGAGHLTYHFDMMLEHAWMTLQAHDTLGTDVTTDIPWIEGTVRFYDTFYRVEHKKRAGQELDTDGKLVLYPCNGLELAHGATNPTETVAGLRRIVGGLLALPANLLPAASRDYLRQLQARLPELPVGERDGKRSLLVAKSHESEDNKWELPELYAAWPYRLVGVTQPDTLTLARDTWNTIPADRAGLCKQDMSWMPTLVDMAALGLPAEAKRRAVDKLSDKKAQVRFPAFFGPGHDWLPDHNWGGSAMTGLQEMLVAAEPGVKGKIYLFPAWPEAWDVKFKLHEPGPTIIECELRAGKIVKLDVSPASRKKDVVIVGPAPTPPVPLSQGKPVTVSSAFNQPGYDASRAVDGDLGTRWASAYEARQGWLEVDLGAEKLIGRVFISEIEWPETREFAIEYKVDDAWKELARGTTIGAEKSVEFSPVRARYVRLNILKAAMAININEFQLFAK